jgi:hypothetical protein
VVTTSPNPTPDSGVGAIFGRLAAPFEAHEVRVRKGPNGRDLTLTRR